MIRQAMIAAVIASFLLASPAMAIQKKSKTSSKSTQAVKGQEKPSDSGEKAGNVTSPKEKKKSSSWRPPREVQKDRFIDENDDGINDNIKKEPAVKVKKRDKPADKPKSEGSSKTSRKRRG